jgi:hypothetical protein
MCFNPDYINRNLVSKDKTKEYHYLFICNNTEIQSLRSKYIPKYYVQNSSVANMAGIFSLCNSQLLKSVALFLKGPILYELVNKNLLHMCFNPDYINRNLVSKDKTKANIIQNSLYIFHI